MLYLIGFGLSDENDMSLRALEAAKKCDSLYAEFYTSGTHTTAAKLSKLTEKPVKELSRKELEEDSGKLLKEARTRSVGILVGGDALTATTHISLLLDAKKAGIETRVIHGSSIYTAIAETGLQIYKFGRTTTLSHRKERSPYDVIAQNRQAGLHTLILLDTEKPVSALQGIQQLLELEQEAGKGAVTQDTKLVAACCLGADSIIRYGTAQALLKDKALDKTPAIIIIPGKTHFMEQEFLETLKL